MELIEKKDAYNILKDMIGLVRRDVLMDAYDTLKNLPTIDAVEVVKCKDCIHYNAGFECLVEGYGIERDPDWYCADGGRKNDSESHY